MSKKLVLTTGAVAFAAGIAVGARWPHSTHVLGLLLDKLGFDVTDLLFMFWDPEAKDRAAMERELLPARARTKRAKTTRRATVKAPAENIIVFPQPVARIRRFSSRPALSAA